MGIIEILLGLVNSPPSSPLSSLNISWGAHTYTSLATAFDTFTEPYQMQWKQPDLFLGVRLPTIVFKVGWSQSDPQLIVAKNLWLQEGENDANGHLLNGRKLI